MTRPLPLSVTWLAAGQAVVAGLYWMFLSTPESNAWMLAASAVLVLLMLATASIAAAGAIDAWRGQRLPIRSAVRGLTHLPWFVVSLAIGLMVWWGAARADAWVASHAGEISAWFIATFDWADASLLFRGVETAVFWVQWVVAPVVGLTLLATLLDDGSGALRTPWLRRAFAFRRLSLATVWIIALVVLPLQVLGWRMSGLPPTWVEPAVVGARLVAVALTATVGWALVCGTVVGQLTERKT